MRNGARRPSSAALRQDGLTAPWVLTGAMDRAAFDLYVETQLAPTLQPGDIVILDNLSVHKSARAKAAIRARGARLLFLPQYSPDLNPIEMALSKLKAHLRAASARTFEALIAALGSICNLFTPQECRNYSKPRVMRRIKARRSLSGITERT
jgi:transposase